MDRLISIAIILGRLNWNFDWWTYRVWFTLFGKFNIVSEIRL